MVPLTYLQEIPFAANNVISENILLISAININYIPISFPFQLRFKHLTLGK